MIGVGYKRKLREFASFWLAVAAKSARVHVEGLKLPAYKTGYADGYADGYNEAARKVSRDLIDKFHLTPPAKRPVRQTRKKK